MKNFTRLIATLSLGLLVACGGSDTQVSTTPVSNENLVATPTPQPAAAPAHEEEHGKLSPELDAFHNVLGPRWHSEPGQERMTKTCAAIAEFENSATKVKAAAAPANTEAAKWADAVTNLETSVSALKTSCAGTDVAAFDNAFSAVHNSFHRAMELETGAHQH